MATALRQATKDSLPMLSLIADDNSGTANSELTTMLQCVSAAARSKQIVKQSNNEGLLESVSQRLALGMLSDLLRV